MVDNNRDFEIDMIKALEPKFDPSKLRVGDGVVVHTEFGGQKHEPDTLTVVGVRKEGREKREFVLMKPPSSVKIDLEAEDLRRGSKGILKIDEVIFQHRRR